MKAIAIIPGKGEPHFINIPEPQISNDKDIIVETLQVGICGTDRAEVSGGRAVPPLGSKELVIGHEMFGRVIKTGSKVNSVKPGDTGLFTVRRGCGKCFPCNNNRSDFCETGDYLERGIKGLNGFQSEYVKDNEQYFVKVPQEIRTLGVLIEPMSVVEKAIDQAMRIQSARAGDAKPPEWPKGINVLIAGLGPVGILAAFILKINGANLFGLDIVEEDSPRAMVIKNLSGTYINGKRLRTKDIDDQYGHFDIMLEATGIAQLEFDLIESLSLNGIYVVTGIPESNKQLNVSGGQIMRDLVLKNQIMIGSVNAGTEHYEMAVRHLSTAQKNWIGLTESIITEKVSFGEFERAFSFIEDEIKTVIEWKQ